MLVCENKWILGFLLSSSAPTEMSPFLMTNRQLVFPQHDCQSHYILRSVVIKIITINCYVL